MQSTLTLDTRGFNQVMRNYAAVNRKTWPEIVNAKALDVAHRALKETPKASKEEIRGLESKEWWPKYVAKRMTKGVSFKRGKSKMSFSGKGFSREDAKRVSKWILAARSRSVAFIKSGWLPAIRRLTFVVKDKLLARSSVSTARQYGTEKGRVRTAVPGDNPSAEIVNSAIGVDKVGVGPLQRAIDGAAQDMHVYIARKMEENARRVAR